MTRLTKSIIEDLNIERLEAKYLYIEKPRDTLLPKLMSGEVRVCQN